MAYVERPLRAITIRSHSDACVRKGRLSLRRLAGENVVILTQNASVHNKRRTNLVLVVATILVASASF